MFATTKKNYCRNLKKLHYMQNCGGQLDSINNIEDVPDLSHTSPSYSSFNFFTASLENNIYNIHTRDKSFDYFSDSDVAFFISTSSIDPSFQERLASYFIDNNFTHVQGNDIFFCKVILVFIICLKMLEHF